MDRGHKTSPLYTGHVAQSVTCLVTDACLTAVPGVGTLTPARGDLS